MSKPEYRTAPVSSTRMPKGVPYIIANEAAERFSFYGMRTILTIFMTKYLVDSSGALDTMSEEDASGYYHLFVMGVYGFPVLGAILSDGLLGKYRTILYLSVVYCAGHLALAMDETRLGLALGCILIAVGSGGIKPCVSAHVGDQFGEANAHLLPRVFKWFYFSINLGAAAASILTPILLKEVGPWLAFGIPGGLMAIATVFFWMGRNVFIHVPPGGKKFLGETFSREGLGAVGKLFAIYTFIAVFWALFDQTGSRWVLQAEHMDREVLGIQLLSSQLQAANPIMVMAMIPFTAFVLEPLVSKVFPLTPLRKIGLGLFITILAFLIPAWLQMRIDAGETPSIMWQVLAYIIITQAEVLVSITALEFSYTQAPRKMKSLVMAFYLMSISVGNAFVAGVNFFIQNEDGTSKLEGAEYYLFFSAAMLVAAVAFVPVAKWFPEKVYLQEMAPPE